MNCLLLPMPNFADLSSSQTTATINAPKQLEHIHHVLNAKVGDTLKIGQIGGNLGTAVIQSMNPDHIQLINVELNTPPPAKLEVTIILALPRPKVLRRLIMDMTAIGVRDIVLINSYRTQKSYWQSPMLARLDEFVLEGLQQGVDTVTPNITLQKRFKPFVEDELAALIADGHAIVAHPYSNRSLAQYLQQHSDLSAKNAISNLRQVSKNTLPSVVCIGSEGGWIDYEIDLFASQGCHAVTIGSRVLRTEAAVNVILGQWLIHSFETANA